MTDNKERTFIMIKPDGVQRGLVGKIIQRFEEKGFKLVAMKMVWVSVHDTWRSIIFREFVRTLKFVFSHMDNCF